MNKKRYSQTPVHEYRIKFLTQGAETPSYHYYMCEDADQALEFQVEMAKTKKWALEMLKIEKYCKFNRDWVDESHVINNTNKFVTKRMHDE